MLAVYVDVHLTRLRGISHLLASPKREERIHGCKPVELQKIGKKDLHLKVKFVIII
jgi:hypothetical protein